MTIAGGVAGGGGGAFCTHRGEVHDPGTGNGAVYCSDKALDPRVAYTIPATRI